jgi:hypothetical protein
MFAARYRALESKFRCFAEQDGDVYLPNIEPAGPVDCILVAIEPSFGRWARTKPEADARIAAGFRNFLGSLEDFLVHHAARTVWCRDGGSYHLTDLSKGAMLVAKARVDRARRYDRWYGLLLDEIDLLAHGKTAVCALGRQVADALRTRRFPRQFVEFLHHSGQAGLGRRRVLVGHEADFDRFAETVTLAPVLRDAHAILEAAGIPDRLRAEILTRVGHSPLTESRKRLLFIYRTRFEALRASQT